MHVTPMMLMMPLFYDTKRKGKILPPTISARLSPRCRNQLLFYSPQAHHAAFVLPPVALRELAKPPPSLRDTTADLEEIMSFGEESDVAGRQAITLSQRWEPDVRGSADM